MNCSSRTAPLLGIALALAAAGWMPTTAAPALRVERSDGSQISMRPRIISWGGGETEVAIPDHPAPKTLPDIQSIFAGGKMSGAVASDGSMVAYWAAYTNPFAVPAGVGPVRGLAFYYGEGIVACRTNGTVAAWGRLSTSLPALPFNLTGIVQVSAHYDRALMLKDDGSVYFWDLSNNTLQSPPANVTGITAVSCGASHNFGLKGDGTVVAWGSNTFGQLNVPAGLGGVVAVAAGAGHTVALKGDGTLAAWGGSSNEPNVPPSGLGPVTAIAAGEDFTAALTADGKVSVWGKQPAESYLPPLPVPPGGLGRVSKIAAGDHHVTALTTRPEDGFGAVGWNVGATRTYTLRNTGSDPLSLGAVSKDGGQAGDFSIQAGSLPSVLAPGASANFSVSFMPGGNGTRWTLLQIASDDPAHPAFEVTLNGYGVNLPPVAQPMGPFTISEDSAGLQIELMGTDPNGDALTYQVYDSDSGVKITAIQGNKVTVVPKPNYFGSTQISYKVKDTGLLESVWTTVSLNVVSVNDPPFLILPDALPPVQAPAGAGANVSFTVGAGDTEDGRLQPVLTVAGQPVASGDLFPPGETVVQVSVSDSGGATTTGTFTVRVVAEPELSLEEGGQTIKERLLLSYWGDSRTTQPPYPPGVSDVIAIDGGNSHSLAIRPDHSVAAWGPYNNYGQASVPAGLADVAAVSAGLLHNVALKSDGTVVAWGNNDYGQANVPPGLNAVVAVSAGKYFTLALKQNGTVVGWGSNDAGQISPPPGLNQVVAIAAGEYHSLALKRDGTVVAWGNNYSGEATPPAWLSGVVAISAGNSDSLALRADGSVVGWGWDTDGQASGLATVGPVSAIAAGSGYSFAVKRDGTLAVTPQGSYFPSSVMALTGVKLIAAGDDYGLAARHAAPLSSFSFAAPFVPVTKTFTVRNSGTAGLELAGLSFVGGSPGSFSVNSSAMAASLPPGGSTSFTVTFAPTGPGQQERTLRVLSNDLDSPVGEILLSGLWQNSAPVATNVGPLALNEDATPLEITLPVSDSDGNNLAFAVVTPPAAAAGTLGPVIGNKVTFTPAANFYGNASFTFRASDGFLQSNLATVSLTIASVEDSPQLVLPTGPVVVQTLGGAVPAEFLVSAADAEDGWLKAVLTRNGVPVATGDSFPVGDTVVQVTVTDNAGRTTTGSFIVRVVPGPDMVLEVAPQGELAKTRRPVGWGSNASQQLVVPAAAANAVRVVSSEFHVVALKADGTVAGWGSNSSNQVTIPAGLANVVDIAVTERTSAALKADGTVMVWGSSATSTLAPPATATNVTAIAGGLGHFLALRGDGSVIAWGSNSSLQCNVPAGLANVVAVAAGESHSLALKADGTVVAWGSNTYGQVTVPAGLRGVRSIAAGRLHSLALRQDGTVQGWGFNAYGQAAAPAGLPGVKAIAAGEYHSVALAMDGQVVTWGDNGSGQLTLPAGLGLARGIAAAKRHTFAIADAPAPVDFGTVMQGDTASTTATIRNEGAAVLDLGSFVLTGGHTADFVVDTTATAFHLAPGESTTFTVRFAPVQNGDRSATLRITGNDTGYPQRELLLTGHGRNGSPAVSDLAGLVTVEDTPLTITLPSSDPESDPLVYSPRNLSPANAGTFGPVTGNQVVFTPAANFNGSVSFIFDASDAGTTSNTANVAIEVTPVNDPPVLAYSPGTISAFGMATGTAVYFRVPQITDVEDGLIPPLMSWNGSPVQSGSLFPPGTHTVNFTATESAGGVISGSFQIQVTGIAGALIRLETPEAVALSRPRAVLEWNQSGVSTETPPDLRGVKQIAAGMDHAFALRNDGTAVGWGSGSSGQLAAPAHLTNATKISCGFAHTIALRSDGTVSAWGSNSSGQSIVPAGLSGVYDVAAGGDFCLARNSSGGVTGWGRSVEGQLSIPANLTNVIAVAAGGFHGMALKADGTVVCWGQNTYGQCNVHPAASGVIAIAAGRYHSVALKSNGSVVSWGRASENQLSTPSPNSNIAAISAGAYHTLARKNDGSLLAWGSYSPGFSGLIFSPSIPPGLVGVTGVAGGGSRAMVSVSNPVALGFGKVANGSTVTRTVVIRNTGTSTLVISSVAKLSGATTINRSTTGMATSVAPGQSTSFTVTFAPAASGAATADFRITSNDRFEPTMDIRVTGEGATPYQVWTSAAGLSGLAASTDAEPFKDGLMNYVKYAFNLNGAGPDHRMMVPGGTSGLPHISVERVGENSFLRVEYLRRKSSGLSYQVERSAALGGFEDVTIEPEITNIDATWERAIVRQPINVAVVRKGFARVRVEIGTPL